MAKLTILCQLNKGCMGCCGHDFDSVEKIKEAIKLNIQEFELVNKDDEQGLLGFRDRADAYDLRFGVCRNLIESDRKLFCPLHPALHQGKDLRDGHCEIDHLCTTAKEFAKWSPEKQDQFISFIKAKKLDPVEYSLQMDNNQLL